MTSPLTLPDGLYTISKDPQAQELATLPSVRPGTDVVLKPKSQDEHLEERVGSISYSYSRIPSYDILFPSPVGDPENTKRNLYDNQPGKLSVV